MSSWSKWDYLKWRAKLAGIAVNDNGTNVEFRKEENGIELIGCFWRAPETNLNSAAAWLIARDVNLPGWQPVQ